MDINHRKVTMILSNEKSRRN